MFRAPPTAWRSRFTRRCETLPLPFFARGVFMLHQSAQPFARTQIPPALPSSLNDKPTLERIVSPPLHQQLSRERIALDMGAKERFAQTVTLLAAGALIDAAAQSTPFANTQAPSFITTTSFTLNGMAVANGLPSVGWFEWGVRGGYDQTTSAVDLGSSTTVVRVSQIVSLAIPGVYQFRLVASNALGVTYGAIQFLTTGSRLVGWGANGQLGSFASAPSNVVAVAGGGSSGLALTAEQGTVMYWKWSPSSAPPTNAIAYPKETNAVAVAAGENFFLALRTNGTVVGWGETNFVDIGQTNVPPGLTNVVAIFAGPRYGLALRSDGTVEGWGKWISSIPFSTVTVPAGLSNVVGLAGGIGHCVALKADGTVQAWGDNYYGQLGVPPGLSNVVAVGAEAYSSLALQADGTVVKWPGSGPSPPPYSPAKIIASNAVAISTANNGALALLSNYTVVGLDALANVPSGLSNATLIASGFYAGYALGPNLRPSAQSQNVVALPNASFVATLRGTDPNGDALGFRIVSLPSVGTLYQYLAGDPGPAITTPNTPVTDAGGRVIFVPAPDGFGEPYASLTFVANDGESDSLPATLTIAVRAKPYAVTQPPTMFAADRATLNGTVVPNGLPTTAWFEWGTRGTFDHTTLPQATGIGAAVVQVGASVDLLPGTVYQCRLVASNLAAVVYGTPRLLGIQGAGKIAAWGASSVGQTAVPPGSTNVVAVAVGGDHNLALKADGSVFAWGSNNGGPTNVPVGLNGVVAIACGDYHCLAVRSNGTVVAWGPNNAGQLNVPLGLSNVIAVAGGGDQSLALKADGTVVAWGANDSRQATVPAGLSNVVAIAGGWHHSIALLADGTLIGWGDSAFSKTANPPGLSNAVAIASAGGDHNVALRADGTVLAWGRNVSGSTTVPVGLSNVVVIGAGGLNSFAISTNGSLTAWGANNSGQLNLPLGLSNLVAVAGGVAHVVALADNLSPTSVAGNVTGYPNHDLLIQLQGSDRNGDPLIYRIGILPTGGTLYQCSAGNRGPAITNPGTALTDPAGRVLFVPAGNALGAPYATFTYVANDGETDSAPSTVTVNIVVPSAPQLNTAGLLRSPAGVVLNFSGSSNATYRLWASSNLLEWISLGVAQPTTNGWFQFLDADATNLPLRFYRAGAP